jgi:hypothetical protein
MDSEAILAEHHNSRLDTTQLFYGLISRFLASTRMSEKVLLLAARTIQCVPYSFTGKPPFTETIFRFVL